MTLIDMTLMPEDEPDSKPTLRTRIYNWVIRKLNTLAFHISCFYFWSRLNWLLPILAILATTYLYSFCAAENWWMKEKVVSVVPTTFVRTAKAAEMEEVEQAFTIPQVVSAVYILESSGGKNDGCRKKGLYNGYGFAQHDDRQVWNCYKSQAQVRTLVEQWYEKKLQTYSLAEALCGYNLGFSHKHHKDCVNQSPSYPYYQNFLKVVKS